MTTKNKSPIYWRGFVDGQNKTDFYTKGRVAVAERAKTIIPLAEYLGVEVKDHRGELFKVELPKNLDKKLPQKYTLEYLQGWFAAKGQVYRDPLKMTICGENIELFRAKLQRQMEMKLPKVQVPSKSSKVTRLTLTGEKAREALKLLRPKA